MSDASPPSGELHEPDDRELLAAELDALADLDALALGVGDVEHASRAAPARR